MVVALRADLIISLVFFAIDDFSAMVTLEPHPFRNLGSLWRFRLGRFLFFKPGHRALLLVRHRTAARAFQARSEVRSSWFEVPKTLNFGPRTLTHLASLARLSCRSILLLCYTCGSSKLSRTNIVFPQPARV